ncbi:MAG: DEAD/DEAH box helicase [Phycisphaerales bacterium]|jgi:ATP-dependent RNA helicase DeaD
MKDTFAELGFGPELLAELTTLGYEEPTPIQKAAAPPLLEGKDLLGQAATGTGKTAAFALPLLQRVSTMKPAPGQPLVLVLVPTRELAVQVSEAFHRYGRGLGISVAPIYGGQDFHRQIMALKRGAHVVIATPGRVLDHMRRGTIDLSGLVSVVLDEADEMLDMGFAEDLELILEAAPETRQTALFSATLPPRIAGIAERHLKEPVRVLIPRDTAQKGSMPKVRQTAYVVPRAHKIAALGRVLDLESPTLAIIFCRTRLEVDELAERLVGRGYSVEALHGGMSQSERDRVMRKARAATVDLLVATDVAARGIDIEHISHVVNFDVPSSPESYVHRIGRTGRAGREGVAITLAEPREHRLVRNIEWITKQKIEIATVPTPHDVKARRLDLTKGTLRETVIAGELDGFRTVVESLAGEYDLMDVAAAAVKLAHEALAGAAAAEDDVHIPTYDSFSRPDRAPQRGFGEGGGGGRDFGPRGGGGGAFGRGGAPRARPFWETQQQGGSGGGPGGGVGHGGAGARDWQAERADEGPRVQRRGDAPREDGERGGDAGASNPYGQGFPPRPPQQRAPRGREFDARDMVRVYIGAGRNLGMRPADIVGAIANEANVNPRGIGDVEIGDRFTLVELPASDAGQVVEALRGATLRGRKVTVRIDDGRRTKR